MHNYIPWLIRMSVSTRLYDVLCTQNLFRLCHVSTKNQNNPFYDACELYNA